MDFGGTFARVVVTVPVAEQGEMLPVLYRRATLIAFL
jgi:hypothetical protein